MQKTLLRTILGVIALGGLLACANAYALKVEFGKVVVSVTADIAPHELPPHGEAPVTLSSITRIKSKDGAPPPALKEIVFMFDKHGSVDTKGLPVCTTAKPADTTPALARKRCAGAIVGEGSGRALVTMPGQAPTEISSPLTFFNAPPVGGKPGLIIHAYETLPAPATVLLPLTIERIKHGRYGYQVKVPIPDIADGFGAATLAKTTLGKTWKRGGKSVSYFSASCQGGRLQVHGVVSLADGSLFPGTLTSPCHAPH